MLRSALLLIIALVASLSSQHATSQAVYSKTVELPALRISYTDLQILLDKAASLMRSANANGKSSISGEEVKLREGELRVKLPGHRVVGTDARLPKTVNEVTYSIVAGGDAAVTSIRMDFGDFRRTLGVDGSSPEQVDAVFAALRDDLLRLSSTLGGSDVRIILQVMKPVLFVTALFFLSLWWQYRTRQLAIPAIVALSCIMFLLLVPADRLLAGFSVVDGDPSFLIRYGPEISFIGLVIGIVAIPVSYVLSRPRPQPTRDASHITVHVAPLPAAKEEPTQTTTATRIAPLTFEQVVAEFKDAPPLQIDAIIERFKGVSIRWETQIFNIVKSTNETVRLTLHFGPGKSGLIICYVALSDYKELAYLKKDAPVTVIGEIEQATDSTVSLTNAQLLL